MSLSANNAVCHCGHHLDTHFKDHKGPGNCLAIGDCDCPGYRDRSLPDTWKGPAPKPNNHPRVCKCYECRHYRAWHGMKEPP